MTETLKKKGKTVGQIIARPFLWLFTFAIPVFIAACYGGYYEIYDAGCGANQLSATGKVLNALNGTSIAQIKVSCVAPGYVDGGDNVIDSTYSLPGDGHFELWYTDDNPCDRLVFEDVDGAENGEFASKTVQFDDTLAETVVDLSPLD
jgi:hypothetical protein